MDLRPYQARAIEEIRAHFRAGKKRVLLWMPTGAGKTHCFSYMMIEAMQKGNRSLMVVRGRDLVDQGSRRLFREGVTHGTLLAGHWNYKAHLPVLVASIDTLNARKLYPEVDLLVIDEAHMATSDGYKKFMEQYPDAFVVAVTATPYTKKSIRHIADEIVHPIGMQELIENGNLVGPRYFAPSEPNLDDVKVSRSTGDYVTDQLANVMDKSTVTGDIVEHYKKLANGLPALFFAVSVEHSKHVARQFCDAGIPAEHCDADTPDAERKAIIARLERGETQVISNVGIFCTGVDIPCLRVVIFGRPTKSYILYIQMAGRGTRPFPGKEDFIILDHAGNVLRHGFITDEPEPDLDGAVPKSGGGMRLITCKECFSISQETPCPLCGWEAPKAAPSPRELLHVDGTLVELKNRPVSDLDRVRAEQFCEKRVKEQLARAGNLWRAFYDTKERFGEGAAKLTFFRICKRLGVSPQRSSPGHPAQIGGNPLDACMASGDGDGVAGGPDADAWKSEAGPGIPNRGWPFK